MNIEELVPLTNGLSIHGESTTMVCDRARLTRVSDDSVDMAFWIAGTDYVPRLRLPRSRLQSSTAEQIATLVRRVARSAVTGTHVARQRVARGTSHVAL
jgi:hypothetical protein